MSEKELIDYIKKYFIYNKDGTFTRTDRRNSTGSFDKDGSLIIKIKGKQYKAHRLVFAYFNNRFPKKEIDHINRDRKDNRIENLREVNRTENVRNTTKKINPDTGVYGVYKDKSTKGLKKVYTFHFQDKSYRFYTVEEAVNKRKELYGEL
jgi:hypothetical protein